MYVHTQEREREREEIIFKDTCTSGGESECVKPRKGIIIVLILCSLAS